MVYDIDGFAALLCFLFYKWNGKMDTVIMRLALYAKQNGLSQEEVTKLLQFSKLFNAYRQENHYPLSYFDGVIDHWKNILRKLKHQHLNSMIPEFLKEIYGSVDAGLEFLNEVQDVYTPFDISAFMAEHITEETPVTETEKPILVIISGIPGIGKSTTIRLLLEVLRHFVCVSQDENGGCPDATWAEFLYALKKRQSVFLDRNNFNESQYKKYMNEAINNGYHVVLCPFDATSHKSMMVALQGILTRTLPKEEAEPDKAYYSGMEIMFPILCSMFKQNTHKKGLLPVMRDDLDLDEDEKALLRDFYELVKPFLDTCQAQGRGHQAQGRGQGRGHQQHRGSQGRGQGRGSQQHRGSQKDHIVEEIAPKVLKFIRDNSEAIKKLRLAPEVMVEKVLDRIQNGPFIDSIDPTKTIYSSFDLVQSSRLDLFCHILARLEELSIEHIGLFESLIDSGVNFSLSHVTHTYGTSPIKEEGYRADVHVHELYIHENGTMALRVTLKDPVTNEEIPVHTGKQPHITVCTARGISPAQSVMTIDEPMVVLPLELVYKARMVYH
jgi:hypothetical protein